MMIKALASIVSLSAVLNVSMIGAAQADDDDDTAEVLAIAQAAGLLSVEEASEKALQVKAGTIVSTDLDERKWPVAGWDYEFDIIDAQGKKWEVEIDAKTGESRKVSRDYF
jgi:uncharacterized membrane protein YkoI